MAHTDPFGDDDDFPPASTPDTIGEVIRDVAALALIMLGTVAAVGVLFWIDVKAGSLGAAVGAAAAGVALGYRRG